MTHQDLRDTPEWMRGPELRAVHDETLEVLNSPQFEFAPLLPGDDADLNERVEALAAWCGGFLYGIAAGGPEIRAGTQLAWDGLAELRTSRTPAETVH